MGYVVCFNLASSRLSKLGGDEDQESLVKIACAGPLADLDSNSSFMELEQGCL